jgi:hypothetical protein
VGGRDPRFLGTNGTTKRCYFEKQIGEVIDNTRFGSKTNRNKPKNKAGKSLKTRSCGKNKPENKPTDLVENK